MKNIKHHWGMDEAKRYVMMNMDNPARGLKYCSALDYLRRFGISKADIIREMTEGGD